MRVLVAKENSLSWHFRCLKPFEALQKAYPEIDVYFFEPAIKDLDEGWDVCVFSELDTPYGEIFLDECKKRKIATIIDIDDDFFSLPPSTETYGDFYTRGSCEPKDKLRFLIRNLAKADLITVTTKVLQEVYSPINSNIVLLPNQIDLSIWSTNESFDKRNEFWIGWQGTYNHWDDFMVVRKPLTEILRESNFIKLVLAGFPEVIHQFPKDVHKQLIRIPFSDDLRQVAKLCRSCDIGLAPLNNCAFNEAKSDLKALQYGAVGLCTVASHVCYSKTIIDKETGLLANSESDWYNSIRQLIDNKNMRQDLGKALEKYVYTERSIEGNIENLKYVLELMR